MNIAHSYEEKNGIIIPEQSYRDHIFGVCSGIDSILERMRPFIEPTRFDELRSVVFNAGIFHDMGKLCDYCQKVLKKEVINRKMPNHTDAGTEYLRRKGRMLAARLVKAHHWGWRLVKTDEGVDTDKETYANNQLSKSFRDITPIKNKYQWVIDDKGAEPNERMFEYTNRLLEKIERRHLESTDIAITDHPEFSCNGMTLSSWMRIALSVLVGADHHDTARNYGSYVIENYTDLQPRTRLNSLVQYVGDKNKAAEAKAKNKLVLERNRDKQLVFQACLDSDVEANYTICPSEVGTGKTTAALAYGLKICEKRKLKKLIYVAPFISIISQTVNTFREALLLPEESQETIAEHHHQIEWGDNHIGKKNTTNWDSPIVATTAVQFFETLASCKTGRLAKLHEIAGSFIIIDESQNCMPLKLWSIATYWLKFLTEELGCRVLFASGTMIKPWEVFDVDETWGHVPSILPAEISERTRVRERNRVKIRYNKKIQNLPGICDWISEVHGSKIVVCNTILNAALIAHALREHQHVLHLSTAQTPYDRNLILEEVRRTLENEPDKNWTLVATSCVESGVDISFKHGFRENSNLMSVLQLAGRVNREHEVDNADLWVFELDVSDRSVFSKHSDYESSRQIFRQMYAEKGGEIGPDDCLEACRLEIASKGSKIPDFTENVLKWEKWQEMGKIARDCKVIEESKETVLIKDSLEAAGLSIEELDVENCKASTISNHTVQMYSDKIDRFKNSGKLVAVDRERDTLWKWMGDYNSFVGYMADESFTVSRNYE